MAMATALPPKREVDLKAKALIKVEAALETLSRGHYSNAHVNRSDKRLLEKIMTITVELVDECTVPESQVVDINHLSKGHKFAHHPTRKIEHIDHIDVDVTANGGLIKLLKLLSPLAAKAGIRIKKGQKEEQKFDREVHPPEAILKHVQGKNYCNYQVKISVQGNFPIRVYQNMLSRHVTTILAQEVLAQLPEFSCDEANNLASCVVVVDSICSCDSTRIRPVCD